MYETPQYVRASRNRQTVYNEWLSRLVKIEARAAQLHPLEVFDAAPDVYSLLESVSLNLFGSGARRYLRELSYTQIEADLCISIFRNGQAHVGMNYMLVYDDGEITWSMTSSIQTQNGKFQPYCPGVSVDGFPEDNTPGDRGIQYNSGINGAYDVRILLDRLAAHVRHDLEQRKRTDTKENIEYIIGQRRSGKRPIPES